MLLLLITHLLACESAPTRIARCKTADCRAALVRSAWSAGEEEGVAALQELPAGIERDALGLELVLSAPERAGAICPSLSVGMQPRCKTAGARPHLAVKPAAQQDEAPFQAAEAIVAAEGADGYARALALCEAAAAFQGQCNDHLLTRLAEAAPPATALQVDWEGVQAAAVKVEAAWQPIDPERGPVVVDQLWSMATWRAVRSAKKLTGDGFFTLPEQAHPHLRAAIVAQLLREQGGRPIGFDELLAAARQALTARQPGAPAGSNPPRFEPVEDLWRRAEVPVGLKAIAYLGTSRRLTSDDPEVDLLICVLEASARYGGPNAAVVRAGVAGHADAAVQATLSRLQ